MVPTNYTSPRLCRGAFVFTFFVCTVVFGDLGAESRGFGLFRRVKRGGGFMLMVKTVFILRAVVVRVNKGMFGAALLRPGTLLMSVMLTMLVVPISLVEGTVVDEWAVHVGWWL